MLIKTFEDKSMAKAVEQVFRRAADNNGRIMLTAIGDSEPMILLGISAATFHSNGFMVVTPERTIVMPYTSIKTICAEDRS